MKEISTLSYLLNHNSQVKTKKSEERLQVREESVRMILSYSKSVKCIKTNSIGDVLMVNN